MLTPGPLRRCDKINLPRCVSTRLHYYSIYSFGYGQPCFPLRLHLYIYRTYTVDRSVKAVPICQYSAAALPHCRRSLLLPRLGLFQAGAHHAYSVAIRKVFMRAADIVTYAPLQNLEHPRSYDSARSFLGDIVLGAFRSAYPPLP